MIRSFWELPTFTNKLECLLNHGCFNWECFVSVLRRSMFQHMASRIGWIALDFGLRNSQRAQEMWRRLQFSFVRVFGPESFCCCAVGIPSTVCSQRQGRVFTRGLTISIGGTVASRLHQASEKTWRTSMCLMAMGQNPNRTPIEHPNPH